ncbi:MAG: M23 family metallopeptidase [Bacteriovoracaceae bacterium]|nr:M23 family metallopeptidase [Bacteriovoracaceae bacterium]
MKISIIYSISIFLTFASCSTSVKKTPVTELVSPKPIAILQEVSIFPGHVKLVKIPLDFLDQNSLQLLKFTCRKDAALPFFMKENVLHAFIVESYFSDHSPFKCRVEVDVAGQTQIIPVVKATVGLYEYKEERINVDKKRVFLSKKDLKRVIKERKILTKIYQNSPQDRIYFMEPFSLPLDSKITSIYGTKRVFNNEKKTQHLGTDFRAPVGEEVPAANSGKVVFAGDLFFSGNTVIIDHGLSIFTVYGHLSAFKTTSDEFIPKGTIIGLSGKTGRVSGPHLHWGVKIQGYNIDGIALSKLNI